MVAVSLPRGTAAIRTDGTAPSPRYLGPPSLLDPTERQQALPVLEVVFTVLRAWSLRYGARYRKGALASYPLAWNRASNLAWRRKTFRAKVSISLCSLELGLRARSVQRTLTTGSEFEKELRSAPVFFPVIPCQRTFALQCPPERALRFQ